MSVCARCMKHHPNHQDNNDEYNSDFIFTLLFLGFVIVPLLVWPMVVALGCTCIITLSFLGEMLFSIPLMISAYFTSAITTLS